MQRLSPAAGLSDTPGEYRVHMCSPGECGVPDAVFVLLEVTPPPPPLWDMHTLVSSC